MKQKAAEKTGEKRILMKLVKVCTRIIIILLLLVLLLYVLIQMPFVQDFARKKIVSFLHNKLHTKVEIGKLSVRFPDVVSIQGVLLQDESQDTLLYGGGIKADISLFRLLKKEFTVEGIQLDNMVVKIKRPAGDSSFNFQFIVNAFSSEEDKNKPTSTDTSSLKIDISRVVINHSRVVYKDAFGGNDMQVALEHLDTRIATSDISHLLFDIPSIEVKGLKGHFYQMRPQGALAPDTAVQNMQPSANPLQLINRSIALDDIDFTYQNELSGLHASFVIGKAGIYPQSLDLARQVIHLREASLSGSRISIETRNPPAGATEKSPAPADDASSFKITAGALHIQQTDISYDNQSLPVAAAGMDYAHLGLQQVSINAKNVAYSTDTMRAAIQSASLHEKSGFVLNELATDFEMTPTGVSLQDLHLVTPGTSIQRSAALSYPSLDAVAADPSVLGLQLSLEQSRISLQDLLIFMPQLKDQLRSLSPNTTLHVDTKITGRISDLHIDKLLLVGPGDTRLSAAGIIKGLPDPKKLFADVDINNFSTTQKDMLSLLPPQVVPAGITLPGTVAVSGKIKGGMQNLSASLRVVSDLGNASVNGSLVNITDKYKARYDMTLSGRQLALGKIMQNPQLGPVDGTIRLKGNGYDPQTATAIFEAAINRFSFNDYAYSGIAMHGSLADKNYKIEASVRDPNLSAALHANGLFTGRLPSVSLKATIDSVHTLPLHFTSQDIRYRGDIDANFAHIHPDSLSGDLSVTHSILIRDGQLIRLDSLSLTARHMEGKQAIRLHGDFFSAEMAGRYRLTRLGDIIKEALYPYFHTDSSGIAPNKEPYAFSLTASVIDHPVLHSLLPSLTQLKPVQLHARFASDSGWHASLSSPLMVYGGSMIGSANLTMATQNDSLFFNTSVRRIRSGTSLDIYATSLSGAIRNNALRFALLVKDNHEKDKYHLAGNFRFLLPDGYELSLQPENLVLNFKKWNIAPDNRISYVHKSLTAHAFNISQEDQHILINSLTGENDNPLRIDFKNFNIGTLTGFIQNDSLMANGLLNGNAVIRNLQTAPAFTADLTISNASVYNDTIGNITAKVSNRTADIYHAEISLGGRGNDVAITGDYHAAPDNGTFDLLLDLKSLQMKTIEGFSQGAITGATGKLYGKIALKGSTAKPDINGRIQFDQTAFTVTTLHNVFKIDNEAIAFISSEGIRFDKFSIRDVHNNQVVIDGNIHTPDFYNYTFDLTINARNFEAVNSTARDNDLFYGKFVFSTRLSIKGTPGHPTVDGSLTVNKNTDFTIVLPQEDPELEKREGIVRFVDRDAPVSETSFTAPYDSLVTSPFKGYDISVNIQVDKEAIFNMIVDQANGDFLRLQGTAELTAGIDASGKITLAGSYEIDDGTYNLSFNFLKRKFNIQKGSRITWTGEPTAAQLNVTAVYIANTAPADLVQNQVVASQANENMYKQKLPFEVHLLLKGELLKPQLSFDIILPEDKNYNVSTAVLSSVQTKLAQMREEEGDMNKQVFALLLLNRFVGENPFVSGGGSVSAGTLAMQSVSRLLSEQLNNLARDLVQGVDINIDVATTQDYTTGTEQDRTNLNVGVSKRLLSDRLTVNVGSDFELQGPSQPNRQQNNFAGNISVNYKLSKDGRYLLRAYRKNDYTGEIEGYVVETGVGFVISVDYNKFKEIFTTKEQRRKKRQIKKDNRQTDKETKWRQQDHQ